ncbi:hypothetical protein ACLKA7_000742 [Drosophila subpalustris]
MEARDPFQKNTRMNRTPPSGNSEQEPMQMALSPEIVAREPKSLREVHEQMSEALFNITTLVSGQRHINQFLRDQLAELVKLNETAVGFSRLETFCKETQTVIDGRHARAAETQTTPQAVPQPHKQHHSPKNATPKRPRDSTMEQRQTPPKKSRSRQMARDHFSQKSQLPQSSASNLARAPIQGNDSQKKFEQQKTARKPRSDAIRVSGVGGRTFADLLRTVKSDTSLKQFCGDVQGIRKAANGDLLLRLTKRPTHSTVELQETVSKALGENAVVKALTDQTRVEVRDLDELTTKDEIIGAINSEMGVSSFKTESIISLRATKDGLQTAVISMPTTQANELANKGKIRIGWLAGSVTWELSNLYTASDHRAILCNVRVDAHRTGVVTKQHYIDSTLDIQTFREAMQTIDIEGEGEDMAGQLMDAVKTACDCSMSRCGVFTGHRPVYWWNDEIAKARQHCYRRPEGTTSILNGWVVAWVLGDRRVKEVPSSSAPSPG